MRSAHYHHRSEAPVYIRTPRRVNALLVRVRIYVLARAHTFNVLAKVRRVKSCCRIIIKSIPTLIKNPHYIFHIVRNLLLERFHRPFISFSIIRLKH